MIRILVINRPLSDSPDIILRIHTYIHYNTNDIYIMHVCTYIRTYVHRITYFLDDLVVVEDRGTAE